MAWQTAYIMELGLITRAHISHLEKGTRIGYIVERVQRIEIDRWCVSVCRGLFGLNENRLKRGFYGCTFVKGMN